MATTTSFASVVYGYPGATGTASAQPAWSTNNPLDTGNLLGYFASGSLLQSNTAYDPTDRAISFSPRIVMASVSYQIVVVHSNSPASFRYAYILWIAVAGLWILYALGSLLSINGSGGFVAVACRKYGSKRFTGGGKLGKDGQRRRVWVSPNLAQISTLTVVMLALFALCFVGPDYLAPTECTWGGVCPAAASVRPPQTTFTNARVKRDFGAGAAMPQPAHRIVKRATGSLNPGGWAPYDDPLLSGPNFRINKNLWTSSSRVGMIAYALLPVSVVLALKTFPFAIFSIPRITNVDNFKMAFFHQWLGRIIWALSTVHVALWTVQLFRDKDPYGNAVFFPVWRYWRFQAGAVAYVAICAVFAFSFKPLRDRHYEFFVWSHRSLVVAFLVGCGLHYRYLGPFCWIALGLWGAERGVRTLLWLRYNGFTRGLDSSERQSGKLDRLVSGASSGADSFANVSVSAQSIQALQGLQRHDVTADKADAGWQAPATPAPSLQNLMRRKGAGMVDTFSIPAGFALAQLLPGRLIRLTFKPPTDLVWRTGQHVSLTIPAVRTVQGHPYTIASADPLLTGSKAMTILIRVKKGFTKQLWEHIAAKRRQSSSMEQAVPGVLLRTQISLPSGTTTNFGRYDSVCIITGGSGVSFGLAIFEHVCYAMARQTKMTKGQHTSRVRFVWLLKEYSHVAWIAPTVRKCLQMAPPGRVQIDFYATSESTAGSRLDPPKSAFLPLPNPSFLSHGNKSTTSLNDWQDKDSEGGDSDAETVLEKAYLQRPPIEAADYEDTTYFEGEDDVTFEGEEDAGISLAERSLSAAVQKQGKIQRAQSRRVVSDSRRHKQAQASDITLNDFPPSAPLAPPSALKDGRRESNQSLRTLLDEKHDVQQSFVFDKKETSLSLDLSDSDMQALREVAEYTGSGRPNISAIVDEEINRSNGRLLVCGCGPASLNTKIRALTSKRMSPWKVLKGDHRGNIDYLVEDFN